MGSLDVKGDPYSALKHLAIHGWISLAQLADILGVTHQAIYQRSDKIPSIKVGRTQRVYEDDVFAQLEKGRHTEHIQVMLELYDTIQRQHHIQNLRNNHE